MTKVTTELVEMVTLRYLHASTMDHIAQETGLSKGTIFKIIKTWEDSIGGKGIEDIRSFISLVKKSNISLQDCALGFRIANMLKPLEIRDEFDEKTKWSRESNNDDDTTNRILYSKEIGDYINNNQNENKKPTERVANLIINFLENVYLNCKKYDIQPPALVSWMQDLFEFYSSSIGYEYSVDIHKESSSRSQKVNNSSPSSLYGQDHVDRYDDSDHGENTNLGSAKTSENLNRKMKGESQELEIDTEKKSSSKIVSRDIPFISQIAYYIEEKKEEVRNLKNIIKTIYQDINTANDKKSSMLYELESLANQQRNMLTFFQWYSNLKQELQSKSNVILEEEIDSFAKTINDFKNHNYDIQSILKDYKEIESLGQQIKIIQNIITTYHPIKENLLNEVNKLEEQISFSKQTMNTYNELYNAGFGLKELKQLSKTILEISLANKISLFEGVSKFLKDVEDQYDNKLGFEKKVSELKAEMEKLKDEVPEYRHFLQIQGIVGPVLDHLSSNGVTNDDIIGINYFVSQFKNGDFLADLSYQNKSSNILGNSTSKTNYQYWDRFTQKLKELRNLNLEIQKKSARLNNLNKQISILDGNRQNLDRVLSDAGANLNNVLNKIDRYTEFGKLFDEMKNSKVLIPFIVLFPVFIEHRSKTGKSKYKKDKNDIHNHE
ncbi:hypothetical protein [Candidatus Nitrosocosmicus sp. FF01]|jgi:hypothetical protein|uniref:hypothetical protein n=1 Tax=Candidatus Nitrosocosmicus sp. FF01 TaxID=3397670 RepID=UPI0039E80AB2